nr:hypothetical protein [Tanacetum cinerariifolium]
MQNQTSNALYNAIMAAGGKDRPPMLAPGNYVQWKSIIKRYIDTKPNHELIHYCLKNLPYKYKWADKDVPVTEGSSETTTERLKQGESINVQDLETNLYWEFGKFTSRDGESLESYYSRFYKMMNELVRNQCGSQELKTVSYHKLYDILKQHQNEVNEIRAERLARTANPLALVAQQQPVYHPQNHPTHYTHNSSTRSQQAATRNRGKAVVNSPSPIYDQEPSMVAEDDEMSNDKEIDKLMDLISLSFKKIYKPTNNNLRTSSNTSRANPNNSPRISRGTRHVARECQKPKPANKEKMLLCKQEEAGFQLNAKQLDWKDDTDDEPEDQELEAHYMYMAQIQKVTPYAADNSEPIFNTEPLQKIDQNDDDDDDDLANECDLLASLIDKLKCEIDDSKNRNKFLETSNKALVDKQKGEIEDFKTKNKTLESSNNHFKEANNELSKTNELMYKDLKKFQAELDRYNDVKYASKVKIDCAKAKGDLMSYKMESKKLFNAYTRKINDFNQTILEMKKELFVHQETISILSQAKDAQLLFYKTREDKEIDKVIVLENKIKDLDNIIYKTAPESDEVIRLKKESRSKLSDLIRPFDYEKLNNLYDLFVPQGVIPFTSVSRPQLKSNQIEDRVMLNNSQGKKQEVEDHRRNVKFSKNKTSVTACNDSLNAKTSNVNFVCVTCGKCMLNDKHDMCVLHSLNNVNSRTKMPMAVPISTREPKPIVEQSVAKPLRRTVASESTN